MNDGRSHRACHPGQSFASFPYADDHEGVYNFYANYWMSLGGGYRRHNINGTPWYIVNGVSLTDNKTFDNYPTTQPWPVKFTFFNHYNDVGDWGVQWKYVVVDNSIKTRVPTDADVLWSTGTYSSSAGHRGATYPVTANVSVPSSVVQAHTGLRLWIKMDPGNLWSEVDETDNWVPTNIQYYY